MLQFSREDLFLNPSDPELPYRRRYDEEKSSIAYGQRKLLLTVVEFLTFYWNPTKIPKPIAVYVGAAPGCNIEIISNLFPEIEFHLYDPAPFKIDPSDRINLYNQYFTDEDANKWSGRSDVYFISDIRTADYTTAKSLDENEKKILQDMMRQMGWYNIIKPVYGHLKFRLPYTGGNRPPTVNYLDGYLFKQVFEPQTSTETRLVPFGPGKTIDWNCEKYQSQMFYHNVTVRETIKYTNPLDTDNPESPIDHPELVNDYDCRCETQILMNYLQMRCGKVNPKDVKALSRLLTKKLSEKNGEHINLEFLRCNPRYIKERNLRPTRDDIGPAGLPTREQKSHNIQPDPPAPSISCHVQPPDEASVPIISLADQPIKPTTSVLAKEIGLE